ncbi:hypothetical protein M0R45_030511 [Rubus argutus]|uniref:Secreted protein n=1 Tax=Rubus argutus TaxID=59490 RepID=A0AAW1WBR9_RUBAR
MMLLSSRCFRCLWCSSSTRFYSCISSKVLHDDALLSLYGSSKYCDVVSSTADVCCVTIQVMKIQQKFEKVKHPSVCGATCKDEMYSSL